MLSARFDGEGLRFAIHADAQRVSLHDADGQRYSFVRTAAFAWESKQGSGGNQIIAPMPEEHYRGTWEEIGAQLVRQRRRI